MNNDHNILWGSCCAVFIILLFLLTMGGHSNEVTSENITKNITADNIPYENITVTNLNSYFKEYVWEECYYYIFSCDLANASSSLMGSKLVVSFYDKNNNLLENNHYTKSYNTTNKKYIMSNMKYEFYHIIKITLHQPIGPQQHIINSYIY